MGKGNSLIRSWAYDNDGHRESVSTYYVEYGADVEDEKEDIAQQRMEDELEPLTDGELEKQAYEHLADRNGDYYDDCIEDMCMLIEPAGFTALNNLQRRMEYPYDSQVIKAEGKYAELVTEDNENGSIAFGFIPSFKWDDLQEEIYSDNYDKQDWYAARKRSFTDRIDELTRRKYDQLLEKYRQEANAAMRMIHEGHPDRLYARAGAWTSNQIDGPQPNQTYY